MFNFSVPRSKDGKTRRKLCSETLSVAIKEARSGCSLRKVGEKYQIPKSTIFKYLHMNKDKNLRENNVDILRNDVKRVFDEEEETQLEEYLEKAAYLHMGLNAKQVRELAYQFAVVKQKQNIPNSWHEHQMAGIGWLRYYRQRHSHLSLRKPEATSLARASSFNKANISKFFDNLQKVIEKHHFTSENIYNLDETGISTVHNPRKVLAPKKIKQLGKFTSGERGVNNTMIACINAVGNSVPPLIVFPRVFFKDNMLKDAPPGTVGAANQSGWSTELIFRKYLDHFIKFAKPTKDDPVLLIMDNHETHISIEIIEKAIDNGIVLLTLPPHTSDNLQPLDRCVFGPFKAQYNKAADKWMLNHPGKPITIYDISEIIGEAYPLAFTPKNIIKSFKVTGICPFNRDIFSEEDFLCSFVTDRPEPLTTASNNSTQSQSVTEESAINLNCNQDENLIDYQEIQKPNTSVDEVVHIAGSSVIHQTNLNTETQSTASRSVCQLEISAIDETVDSGQGKVNAAITPRKQLIPQITPESVRPFLKADPRKATRRGRKPGKSRILTDTPEKNEIKNESIRKAENKRNIKEKNKNKKSSLPKKTKHSSESLPKPGPSQIKIQSAEKRVTILQDQQLPYAMCMGCKRHENVTEMLNCSLCDLKYHRKCVSRSHIDNFESDDESGFVCQKCYILDDGDSDASDDSALELYEKYCGAKKGKTN